MKLKSVKALSKERKELDAVVKNLAKEHNKYGINGTDEEIKRWFDCLPIETLRESIDFENKIPREKYSLQDMKKRFSIRKLHEKKVEDLDRVKQEIRILKIESLLSKIEKIL